MKALLFNTKTNEFEININYPIPNPGPGEVRIKCIATGINPVDAKIRNWKSMLDPSLELITPGLDVCGVIDEVGIDVVDVRIGCYVLYHGRMLKPHGGFAEYAIHDASTLLVLSQTFDETIDPILFASLPCAAWTAYRAVYEKLRIMKSYDSTSEIPSLVVIGASGGVGSFALQFARQAGLKMIIAVCSGKNFDYVKQIGATDVIDYTTEDIHERIMSITNDEGIDFVIDCVGAETVKQTLKAIKFNGIICPLVSFAEGNIDAFLKSVTFSQVSLGGCHFAGNVGAGVIRNVGKEVIDGVLNGHIQVPKIEVICFENIIETLDTMLKAHTTGKIVLKL